MNEASHSPQALLAHCDAGSLWPAPCGLGLAQAYQRALQVRALRIARGELPRGYKIGFTNRGIWQRYQVFAPIWGTVWNSTLQLSEGAGEVNLAHMCQPRIEPEAVLGMACTPPPNATLDDLFACLDWVAPGFEVVQSHLPDWKFAAADTVLDGGLHAHLLVGPRVPVRSLARNATEFEALLASSQVRLACKGQERDAGQGANVLDGPLHALQHFLQALRSTPNATDLIAGDAISTGTWTDAWPVQPGERWAADFSAALPRLEVVFR